MAMEDNNANSWEMIHERHMEQIRAVRKVEDTQLEEDFRKEVDPLKRELATLYAKVAHLEQEVDAVNQHITEREAAVHKIERKAAVQRTDINKERRKFDKIQDEYYAGLGVVPKATKAQAGHPDAGNRASATNGVPVAAMAHGINGVERRTSNGDAMDVDVGGIPHRPRQDPASWTNGIGVVRLLNSDGIDIGAIGALSDAVASNVWIQTCKKLPFLRSVQLREGWKLTQDDLRSIHNPSDRRGAKWIGCMIQAKGEIQAKVCDSCSSGTGTFTHCIMIPGDDPKFTSCGNCEWGRQDCRGAVPAVDDKRWHSRESVGSGGFTPVNNKSLVASNLIRSVSANSLKDGALPRNALLGTKRKIESDVGTPSGDMSPSVTGVRPADEPEMVLTEITKATLSLRHDGQVYTAPEIMEGVPLRKINKTDAYWEPSWKDAKEETKETLAKWEQKYARCLSNPDIDTEKHAKFLANRQVNRGGHMVKFLEDDNEISPFQIVGKRFITNGIINYDVLHRLVATLIELRKFHSVDCAPLDWLRHRLQEIYSADPDGFQLHKVVGGLYHDIKLQRLRSKNGFGNIGRPSGSKPKKDGNGGPSPKKKRKELHRTSGISGQLPPISQIDNRDGPEQARQQIAPDTPPDAAPTPVAETTQTPEAEDAEVQPKPSGVMQPQTQANDNGAVPSAKKARMRGMDIDPDDLECSGYTSTDSYSRDKVMRVDWRISQIKTADRMSNTEITQYWHWVDPQTSPDDGGNYFEHQVLREVQPPAWGVYKEPINFHLHLSELKEIKFSNETLRIQVRTKPADEVEVPESRGDILAQFKRERTKRRFLKFAKKKGVRLRKVDATVLDNAWESLNSYLLPVDDSE